MLVVVVVGAIALAAGVDALRGDSAPEPATEASTSEPQPTSTAAEPEAPAAVDGLEGVLYFTDESCRLQAGTLPDLTPTDTPNWDECRFVLSPDGRRVAGAGSGWDPHADPRRGRLFQSEDGTIQVSTNGGPDGEPFQGAAPAWRPDGTLTYFAHGAVREWPGGNVILPQRALLRAARTVPFPSRLQAVSLREAAWLDDRRLAAIMSTRIRGAQAKDMLAIYDGTRLVTWRLYEQGSDLRVSPQGSFVAVRIGRDQFDMLDASGESIDTLGIVGYRAIAWSPDEEWVAVAADGGVFLFRPGVPGPPDLDLALDARDLDWRGDAGTSLTETEEASDWLQRVGVGGRLLVSQGEGGACRLRALAVPDLTWGEPPGGRRDACRFAVDADGAVTRESASECGTGCRLAERPDGSPTFVSGGELFAGSPDGRSELLVSATELEQTFGRPSALEEVSWVDGDRFWAVVRSRGSANVALLTTDGLVFSPSFTTRRIENLRASSTGMVAASSDLGVVFFDSGGRRALTFPNGRDVSWAPGELVAAVSTPRDVLFVAPVSGEVVTLSLEVSDLEWVVP